jgi:hypothetical protein
MVAEVFGGIAALKSAFDIAKTIKDMSDAAAINAAVIDLQNQILAAQIAQSALLDEKRGLEKKMAEFETWDAEQKKYDFKQIGYGSFAYMLKPEARGTKPPHWVCANCYGNRRIRIFQYTWPKNMKDRHGQGWFCQECASEVHPDSSEAKWLD